jgi:vitamin B12 transporter
MQVNNQQLVYVPKHIANMFVQIKHNNTSYFADLTYTGERFFDYVGNKLPTHLLTNVGISYKIAIHNHFLNLSSHVDNLFNNDYQNEIKYAMPGRTYKLSASLDINIYKH